MDRVYPGTRADFQREFGGEPGRVFKYSSMIMITILILIIIVIITCYYLLQTDIEVFVNDRNELFNLDLLDDVNDGQVECCIPQGKVAPTRAYVYDATADITYSRDRPTNIDVVCAGFSDVNQCIADNTDENGVIIPRVTFEARPYFVFEKGQFIGCPNTTTC